MRREVKLGEDEEPSKENRGVPRARRRPQNHRSAVFKTTASSCSGTETGGAHFKIKAQTLIKGIVGWRIG